MSRCPEIGRGCFRGRGTLGHWRTNINFQLKSKEACAFVSELTKLLLDGGHDEENGESWRAFRWRPDQPPVEHAVSFPHKKVTVTMHCQELQTFCSCWHLCKQSKALRLHFLKQRQESSPLLKPQFLTSWVLQIYKCQLHMGDSVSQMRIWDLLLVLKELM